MICAESAFLNFWAYFIQGTCSMETLQRSLCARIYMCLLGHLQLRWGDYRGVKGPGFDLLCFDTRQMP